MRHRPSPGIPTTPETCIAFVQERLCVRLGRDELPAALEQVVIDEVERLWRNPIKTFIPVLATRVALDHALVAAAGAVPTDQGCPGRDPDRDSPVPTPKGATQDQDEPDLPDTPGDTLAYSRRDTLPYGDRDLVTLD